ncbi:MAG: SAVED domain-containing protein [Caulobacteraceae bacterium]
MSGDDAARRGLGALATTIGTVGLGILWPGIKDWLIALLDQGFGTHLYTPPAWLGGAFLALAIVLWAAVLIGPARLWSLIEHRAGMAGTTKGYVVALKQTGFDPNLPDLRPEELPDELAHRAIQHVSVDLSSNLRRSPPDISRALEEQLQVPTRLAAASGPPAETQLAYCGIVQAPFQLLAGHQLAGWSHVLPFEWDRVNRRWHSLPDGPGPDLGLQQHTEAAPTGTDLAIAIEVSSRIDSQAVLGSVPSVGEIIRIGLATPKLDVITHQQQALAVGAEFRAVLDHARARYGDGHPVHVFCAAPMSVGFALGRLISPTIDGPVTVYAFDAQATPPYPWGLIVNSRPQGPQIVRT